MQLCQPCRQRSKLKPSAVGQASVSGDPDQLQLLYWDTFGPVWAKEQMPNRWFSYNYRGDKHYNHLHDRQYFMSLIPEEMLSEVVLHDETRTKEDELKESERHLDHEISTLNLSSYDNDIDSFLVYADNVYEAITELKACLNVSCNFTQMDNYLKELQDAIVKLKERCAEIASG